MMSITNLFLVACGGALGALARFLIHHSSRVTLGEWFPVGTLIVNLLGSFLIGLCLGFDLQKRNNEPLFMGAAVGFLGSLTTFSTFAAESFALSVDQHTVRALGNVLANVVGCLVAVAAGVALAGVIRGND